MTYRRHSVISQPTLPEMPVDPLQAWLDVRKRSRKPCLRKPRVTAAEKRLQAARRDPRQVSIFGRPHTEELTQPSEFNTAPISTKR